MSNQLGQAGAGRALTRFFIGFAMIEGAILVAILLAMVFEVITNDQMVMAMVAVVLIGGLVLSFRLMSLAREQRNRAARARPGIVGQGAHLTGHQSEVSDSDRSGINKLGDSDPMSKYRDPNS
ncbi:hypothetical protein [Ruania rhizosphaerae]|uniref:hypothetical protein n=1 Tax=Ruania rhizosphaerae TaxID=1840413 RepID=UPI001356E2A4|nr:hypothetical protein [Ruania rhizosphaerae]